MKPSTYLKNRYKSQKKALRQAFLIIDYYLAIEDIKHLESPKK